eukprot:GILJ01004772.1.p1 GENE.GILJ01004772.1~~GILJ01004772.1.p1  ORF type:complete len:320 (+),score=33.52 GILJ01004772.1:51-1010(+)
MFKLGKSTLKQADASAEQGRDRMNAMMTQILDITISDISISLQDEDNDDIEHVCGALQKRKEISVGRLSSVTIKRAGLMDAGRWKMLLCSVLSIPVERLVFEFCTLSTCLLDAFTEAREHCASVSVMELVHCTMDTDSNHVIEHLASVLPFFSSLTALKLEGIAVNQHTAATIINALKPLSSFTTLQINDSRELHESSILASALAGLVQLRSLFIDNCGVWPGPLLESLLSHPSLRLLSLRRAHFIYSADFAKFVSVNSTVEVLDLRGCPWRDYDADAVTALSANTRLKDLRISAGEDDTTSSEMPKALQQVWISKLAH